MVKGVFFSRDPGGTNALIPIARQLSEERDIQIFNFASSLAIPLWRQSGLEFTPLPDSMDRVEIDQVLRRIAPDFLFTGTSENTNLEGNFWLAAKQQRIFTYSIVDHWTSYKERYVVDGVFTPTDLIFTIDELAKKEMIALGFHNEHIKVSGQPHFEEFLKYKSELSRTQFCEQNQLSSRKIILFISDTISYSFPATTLGEPVLGFDEHTVLNALLDELQLMEDVKNEFQLIIKLHPKEPEHNFSKLMLSRKNALPFRIIKAGNNMDIIFHADYAIGMFSMMLFEAYLMNKPVLSLQLNSIKPIGFGLNKVPMVVEQKELKKSLRKFLIEGVQPKSLPPPQAVTKIIETIKNIHFQ